ncbi:unnamed protein product [Candida verbasci]|uniref:VPS9 domain-containing protein n=1 Tax=Candida verbasci TaxID=1227364 RepID=A0A9W4TWG8_9ASCO|nr:unnamed protein product [Candida verbasci]
MNSRQPISYLPICYNPFINCIFNNPQYNKSPFKNIIEQLKADHTQFTLLIPPAYILNEYYDPSTSNTLLKYLCYHSEDFLKSHIIKTAHPISSTITPISKEQSVIYNTVNNKQILIKNRTIYTGKGFKRSLKLRIASIQYFNSFCDYLPKGSKFMIIYIESSLIGGVPPLKVLPPPKSDEVKQITQDTVTFEKLLRSFPLLSKAVSDKFLRLFHHNNYQFRNLRYNTRKKLVHIKIEFQKVLEEAFKIISDSVKIENPNSEQTYNLLNHILKTFPGIDLSKLVHEYVEINLYDVLWSQLIFQFNCPNDDYDLEATKILTKEKYEQLSCLSLTQLDLPIDEPWQINELQERVSLAIQEFKKLSDSSIIDSRMKTGIIYNTFKLLTQGRADIVISADTLIGLLIMVVIHSKINNLEAHLYYIKNFNVDDHTKDGHFNYIISNLDAVLYHFSSENSDLVEKSEKNYVLWNAIHKLDIKFIEEFDIPNKELPDNHFIKSKNINGENCLMFAINVESYEIFKYFIDNDQWFSIDEILFERNIITNYTLVMNALTLEAKDILHDLVDLILNTATKEEHLIYFNSVDSTGRSVGHYLFHDYTLIAKIGDLINWELKDNNGHTPLVSLCRCYDHPEYIEIVKAGFNAVYKSGLDSEKHVDKQGNTLLHILLKGITESEILEQELVDINQTNSKYLTPLDHYIKYNRMENLRTILKDERLDFLYEDSKNFYNVFDYLNFSALKSSKTKDHRKIENLIMDYYLTNYFPKVDNYLFVLNGKYNQNNKEWVISFRGYEYTELPVSKLKQILYLTKLKYQLTTFPSEDMVFKNFNVNNLTTPIFSKFRVNRFIDILNLIFQSLAFQNNIDRQQFYKSILIKETLSTLEQKQLISETIENQKIAADFKLNEIDQFLYFLEFSLNDLNGYMGQIRKLSKLSCAGEIKQIDHRNVQNIVISKFRNEFTIPEFHNQKGSIKVLYEYINWIALTGDELLENIYKLFTDIKNWKSNFQTITSINKELQELEPEDTKITKTNSSLSINPLPETEFDDESGLFSFKKSKKTRYKNLINEKSNCVDQIKKLNIEIKYQHEIIAAEISNYFKFRNDFLKFGIKQFAKQELKSLKQRNLELKNYLLRY